MQKRRGLERAQLLDALLKLVLLVFELLFLAQTLAFLERLVLAMSLFVRCIRRVDPFVILTSRSKTSPNSLVLGQQRVFGGLDELLLAVRVNHLRLVEIPFVCRRVEL